MARQSEEAMDISESEEMTNVQNEENTKISDQGQEEMEVADRQELTASSEQKSHDTQERKSPAVTERDVSALPDTGWPQEKPSALFEHEEPLSSQSISSERNSRLSSEEVTDKKEPSSSNEETSALLEAGHELPKLTHKAEKNVCEEVGMQTTANKSVASVSAEARSSAVTEALVTSELSEDEPTFSPSQGSPDSKQPLCTEDSYRQQTLSHDSPETGAQAVGLNESLTQTRQDSDISGQESQDIKVEMEGVDNGLELAALHDMEPSAQEKLPLSHDENKSPDLSKPEVSASFEEEACSEGRPQNVFEQRSPGLSEDKQPPSSWHEPAASPEKHSRASSDRVASPDSKVPALTQQEIPAALEQNVSHSSQHEPSTFSEQSSHLSCEQETLSARMKKSDILSDQEGSVKLRPLSDQETAVLQEPGHEAPIPPLSSELTPHNTEHNVCEEEEEEMEVTAEDSPASASSEQPSSVSAKPKSSAVTEALVTSELSEDEPRVSPSQRSPDSKQPLCTEDSHQQKTLSHDLPATRAQAAGLNESPIQARRDSDISGQESQAIEEAVDALAYEYGEAEHGFPKTLEEFGYKFNEDGELRTIDTNEPFKFVMRDDHEYNQMRYEALGEVVTEYVYDLLEKAGLKRITIPVDAKDDEPKGFFFMSPEADKKDTVLLLIHGSGEVRAGQWSRKLIINNSLEKGTQLPYVEFGLKQDYGVIVLNTNQNYASSGSSLWTSIRGSQSPEDHAVYVWDHFLDKSEVGHLAVVAHSYGGIVTTYLSDKRPEFQKRVFAIAFTDSVHGRYGISRRTKKMLKNCAVNWVTSSKPLDTELPEYGTGKRVSAGHNVHEWTSHAAKDSVFKYITERCKKRSTGSQGNCTCM